MLTGLLIAFFAAVLPGVLHTWLFYWADRYEREPRWLLTVAFLWGAVPAILASMLLEQVFSLPTSAEVTLANELTASSVVAPIVEEICKGIAVWLIYRWRQQEFDGVLDGLVYGALVGFGFAMTEDFFYYVGAYGDGDLGNLSFVIFLRAILFGLNHGFFTGLVGIGFGLARNQNNPFLRRFFPLLGLSAAIILHSLHNFGASMASVNVAAILISLGVAAGSIACIVLVVLLAWRQERECLRSELQEEVGVLLGVDEYENLTGHWRGPTRSPSQAQATRLQKLAELALAKRRLRVRGIEREPELARYIGDLHASLNPGNIV